MKALARKHDPNHVPNPNYKITKAEPDTPATKAAQGDKSSSNNSSNNQQATQPQKSGNKRKSKQRYWSRCFDLRLLPDFCGCVACWLLEELLGDGLLSCTVFVAGVSGSAFVTL